MHKPGHISQPKITNKEQAQKAIVEYRKLQKELKQIENLGEKEYTTWAIEQNEKAYAESSEKARLSTINDNMHKAQKSFLWNLPGSISPLGIEEIGGAAIAKGIGKGYKYLKRLKGKTKPLKELATETGSKYSNSPLSKEMEPYLSRYEKPISREQEVFENSFNPKYQKQKIKERTVHLDNKGNKIPTPKGYDNYTPYSGIAVKRNAKKTIKNNKSLEGILQEGKAIRIHNTKAERIQNKELKEYYTKEINSLNSFEGRKRLNNIGLDPDKTIKNLKNTPIEFDKINMGSGYVPVNNAPIKNAKSRININREELKMADEIGLKLNTKSVIDHELAHAMQMELNRKKLIKNLYPRMTTQAIPGGKSYEIMRVAPTSIDNKLGGIIPNKNLSELDKINYNYFKNANFPNTKMPKYKHERMAHLREFRGDMVRKGIIKDNYELITKKHIKQFQKETPENRMNLFMDKRKKQNYKILLETLNKLPVSVGAIGVGYSATKNKNK